MSLQAVAKKPVLGKSHSIILLTDSFVSIKLVQHELLVAKKTYSEIAKRANVSASTVANIAIGHTKLPRLETIIRILYALQWVISASRSNDDEAA